MKDLDIPLKNKIHTIRDTQVILDSDLAKLYEVETKYLKRQVRRNIDRFPKNFMFELTENEYKIIRSQNGTLDIGQGKHPKYLPYVFTEHGVSMLASLLKSDKAINISIKIIETFVNMRRFLHQSNITNNLIMNKIIEHDKSIAELFSRFKDNTPKNEEIGNKRDT